MKETIQHRTINFRHHIIGDIWEDQNGLPHNGDDKPAYIEHNKQHTFLKVIWYDHGNIHRLNGPALVQTSSSTVYYKEEHWFKNHVRHRSSGPAIIYLNDKLAVLHCQWYLNGVYIDRRDIDIWHAENRISWPYNKNQEILFKLRFS